MISAAACIVAGLWDVIGRLSGPVVLAIVFALGALVFYRLGAGFVADYRRLRVDACTLLTTHAPLFTNLEMQPTAEEIALRRAASDELRRIADRLTNADCPPQWLTRLLAVPSPSDFWEAGRTIRGLSNALFLPHNPTVASKDANEQQNRESRDEARRLLRCRPQRPWERA
ncbi:MAG TPA: hypothetical protein VFD92_10435 [Candidatus Binatia bacterium]|nr:hypothetical protein [Candidatus Binatia bacterium]